MLKVLKTLLMIACPLCLAGQVMALEPGIDRPGFDYRDFDLTRSDPMLCLKACINDRRCRAFSYVSPVSRAPRPAAGSRRRCRPFRAS